MTNETISGTVGRVFYVNHDGPSMAGVLDLDDANAKRLAKNSIRFAGKVSASPGDEIEIVGQWVKHPKFGDQFDVSSGLAKMNESPDALVHLLATHSDFKGLGPVKAHRVVDAAMAVSEDGEVTSALTSYPEAIAQRANVSLDIVQNAAKVWGERRHFFDALAHLVDQGWSSAQATRIVNKLGDNAPAMIKNDPYMLIGKLSRFGFRTVDIVARKMGVSSTDRFRLHAGVVYCLDKIAENGNTWTSREGLFGKAVEELQPDTLDGEDKICGAIEELIQVGMVYVDQSPTGVELVANARLAAIEFSVFERLINGLKDSSAKPFDLSGPASRNVVTTLNDGQRTAIEGISRNRFGVISGGAGVGKTYTMRSLCEIAKENQMRIALCAPTGKAARKLAHATGRTAYTIHRLLVPIFDPDTGGFTFTKNANDQLRVDMVIVDEFSMVDVRLMHSLLEALKPSCRLVFVGDHHQIPSVGPGAILRDLLAGRPNYSAAVHVLTEIVRQAGILARNTTALLDGVVVKQPAETWNIERTEKGNEHGAAAMIAVYVETMVTAPEPVKPFDRLLDFAWDIQVLSPMRKGPLGTWAINVHLQKLRQRLLGNPPPDPTPEGKSPKALVGDRIIWTKNDYELDLFNGTQAIVTGFPKGGSMDLFTEDGREVTIPAAKRINAEVSYAMTIHKSQGSEFPMVILVASSSHWIMHDRNLLYTGASRAAEALTIFGDMAGLSHFAAERRSANRQTFGGFFVHGWQPRSMAQDVGGDGSTGTSLHLLE